MAVEAVGQSPNAASSNADVSEAADGASETPTAGTDESITLSTTDVSTKPLYTIQDWVNKFHLSYEEEASLISVQKGYMA